MLLKLSRMMKVNVSGILVKLLVMLEKVMMKLCRWLLMWCSEWLLSIVMSRLSRFD